MGKIRIISGLVLFSLLLVILVFGNTTIVNITASAVGILAINEYFKAFKNKRAVKEVNILIKKIENP